MIAPAELDSWSTEDLSLAAAVLEEELQKAQPLSPQDYLDRQQKLLSETDQQVSGYARQLAQGKISPAQFRQRMTNTLRVAHAAAYRNGASSVAGRVPLDDSDLAQVAQRFGAQLGYLDGFSDDIKAVHGTEGALSEAALTNRAGMYADALRSSFWAGTQSQYDPAQYQVRYICRDDATSCSECSEAAQKSPYPVGQAPLPGEVCAGLTNCRCELQYDRKPASALDIASDAVSGLASGAALGDELQKALELLGPAHVQMLAALDGCLAWDELTKGHKCWGYDCGGAGAGSGGGPSRQTVARRDAKIAAAPLPSAEDIARNATVIGHSGRAGGDLRGNAAARAVRTQKLLTEFGDGQTCQCVWCGQELNAQTLTQDKIFTASQGGRYRMPNLLPSCLHCNQVRNDAPIAGQQAAA